MPKPKESEKRLHAFVEDHDYDDGICTAFASDFRVIEPEVDETIDERFERGNELRPLHF